MCKVIYYEGRMTDGPPLLSVFYCTHNTTQTIILLLQFWYIAFALRGPGKLDGLSGRGRKLRLGLKAGLMSKVEVSTSAPNYIKLHFEVLADPLTITKIAENELGQQN